MEGDLEVKLVKETLVAPDGIHSRVFKVGNTISLPKMIADGLVRDKLAVFTSGEEQARHDKEMKAKRDKEREAEDRAIADQGKQTPPVDTKGQNGGAVKI